MAITATGIQNLYVAYYGRPADPSGLAYWLQVTAAATAAGQEDGAVLLSLSNSFGTNAEYTANFTGLNNDGIINKVYLNLFSHSPDAGGLLYWSGKLTSGALTLAQIVQAVSESAVAANNVDGIAYTSKVSAAAAFTTALDTTEEILGYSGVAAGNLAKAFISSVNSAATLATAIAPAALAATVSTVVTTGSTVAGQTFTLTTGVDTLTGTDGNDTFNAGLENSFSALDVLTGGLGTDTLNIIDTTGGFDTTGIAGTTVTGIEVVNVRSGAATVANTTTWTGVTALNSTQSAAATLTAAATTAVSVSGATGAITVDGGSSVTATTAATTVTIGATTGAAGAINVTHTAQAANAIAIDGGTSVTVTSTGRVAAGTIVIGGDASPILPTGAVIVTATEGLATGGTAALITVNGGSTVAITENINGSAAAIVTAATAGAPGVVTGGAITVNGSAVTTAVNVTQTAAKAAVAYVAATGSVAAITGVLGVVNGAVAINDVNRASATAAGTITTATVTNAAAVTVNSGALTTLNLGGTLTTVDAGILGALTTAANTALAVNLTGATIGTSLTVDTDITTINITGAGTANTIASLVNASATAVNVSGAAAVTITADTLAAAAVITSTNTAGTTVTQQLLTGQQFVGGDGADTASVAATTKAINMGAGNDIVTISTETLGVGGSINGGTGTNTIVANTNTSSLSTSASITNFTTLRVAGAAAQGTHSALGFTALEVGTTAAAVVLSNVAAGTGLTINAGPTGGVTYTLANAAGTSDVLNLVLTSAGALTGGSVTAAGIETINITATDTDTTAHVDTLTLAATSATSITVTGNTALTLTNTTETKVATFSAAGVTAGAVTYTSAATIANTATTTITGGAGADILTGGATADTINGGAGNDTLTGGAGSDTIDGGLGVNTFSAGTAFLGAAVEGLNTGTATGMVINLSAAAITAATINTAMTGTVGVSASLTSVASGKTANIYATQDALFSTTQDTLSNIQNVTGSTGADYIVGSAAANVITGGAGVDVINGGAGADTIVLHVAAANNDAITFVVAEDIVGILNATTELVAGATVVVQTVAVKSDIANRVIVDTIANLGAAGVTLGDLSAYTTGDVHYAVASDTGAIFYDADGNWTAGVIAVGTLTSTTALTAANFTVV